ncbi:MAG: hypothetical protein HC842_09995 [Cytophagales bacterium]|nr:hypothetical protein [Cytophagales bacterium]
MRSTVFLLLICTLAWACQELDYISEYSQNPDEAPVYAIDRFSDSVAYVHRRSANRSLPLANEPIDFDQLFLVKALGPEGQAVRFYDLDARRGSLGRVYEIYRFNTSEPIEGQLRVFSSAPGQVAYSDLWRVYRVFVPSNFALNSVNDANRLTTSGFTVEETNQILLCALVPSGSRARLRRGAAPAALQRGWYADQVVHYLEFDAEGFTLTETPEVQFVAGLAYAAFNSDPTELSSAAFLKSLRSGFASEADGEQTHVVFSLLPPDLVSPVFGLKGYYKEHFGQVLNYDSLITLEERDSTTLFDMALEMVWPLVSVE